MKLINTKNFENSGNIAEVQAVYKTKIKISEQPKITNSEMAKDILLKAFNKDTLEYKEEFIILLLNRTNRVLGYVKISSGGTTGTTADPKIIFTLALKTNASAIILAHNHPSGNLKPSKSDLELTNKLVKAGKLLDITIFDHIILSKDGHYSMADENQINNH